MSNLFHEYNSRNMDCDTCQKIYKMQETEDRQREDYHEVKKVEVKRQYVDALVSDFYKGSLEIRIKNKNANSQKNAFEYDWLNLKYCKYKI